MTKNAILATLMLIPIAALAQSPLSEILPEGEYQIIFSPIKPDLENRNVAPEAFDASINYQGEQAMLVVRESTIPIHFKDGGGQTIPAITFTIPPSDAPNSWFVTRVFSGSPWSKDHPGKINGRAWTIRGYPTDAEEFIFSLTRKEKK